LHTAQDLRAELGRIDGRGYKAYKDIEGAWDLGRFMLFIDHAQGDPFAAPSLLRARVAAGVAGAAGFPADLGRGRARRVALGDFLARAFAAAAGRYARGRRGTGKSGLVAIDCPGQEVLERSAVLVADEFVEARFAAGLPAAGRSVLGREAAAMLLDEVPRIVEASLYYGSLDGTALRRHVELVEDQEALRVALDGRGLVAFVPDGAILPRESGVSDRPLESSRAVRFASPPALRVTLQAPNAGAVTGMGVPRGLTVIAGGGYHGKSTLLRAIERGVYDHVAGDGRELCVAVPGAVKVRAEDGRRVERVDISAFITNLPQGQDTAAFSSEAASGSTSQAANIMEALEVGATCLLMDEDTSAANFMARDERMQALVPAGKEPITPFIDRVAALRDRLGVSTVLVAGGSGDFFDLADCVVVMEAFRPSDATAAARDVARRYPRRAAPTAAAAPPPFGPARPRVPLPGGFDAWRGRRERFGARGPDAVQYGRETIDLHYVEQIVDPSQTAAIAAMIHHAADRYVDGRRSLPEVIALVMHDIDELGLDALAPHPGQHPGELARPRALELAAAINRLRTLRVQ